MTLISRRHTGVLLAASTLMPRIAMAAPAPIRASLNENPYGPSPNVLRVLQGQVPQVSRYGDAAEADKLIQQIATLEGVSPDQVVLGELLEALGLFLAARRKPGGNFVYSVPGYPALVDAGRPVGAQVIGVPLNADLQNDLPALGRAITADTKALYLVNPHNPSGTANDPEAFERFLTEASRKTLVVVDEAYIEYATTARSAVSLTRAGQNVAVFRTLDKVYGLAGLPIGYLLAPVEPARDLKVAGFGDAHGIGRLPIAAAQAALADQAWVAKIRGRIAQDRARLTHTLDALNLQHTKSEANFVFFRSPKPAEHVRAALSAKGVIVGKAFPPLDQWIRISIGTDGQTARIEDALHRLFG